MRLDELNWRRAVTISADFAYIAADVADVADGSKTIRVIRYDHNGLYLINPDFSKPGRSTRDDCWYDLDTLTAQAVLYELLSK